MLDGMEDYLSEEDAVEVSAAMGSQDVVPTALQKAFDLVDDFAEMDELAMSQIDIRVNEHARRGLVPSVLEDITPERVLHVPISEEDAATQAGALCESCSLARLRLTLVVLLRYHTVCVRRVSADHVVVSPIQRSCFAVPALDGSRRAAWCCCITGAGYLDQGSAGC